LNLNDNLISFLNIQSILFLF